MVRGTNWQAISVTFLGIFFNEVAITKVNFDELFIWCVLSADSPMSQPHAVTLKHVVAPVTKPPSENADKPGKPNACPECGKTIM